MSAEQLREACYLHNLISSETTAVNMMPMSTVRTVFMNHLRTCLRIPLGGASAGGSQQTGYEMELVSTPGVSELMRGWPNHESSNGGRRQSWELRSMEELAGHLSLEDSPAGWGVWHGKPMALTQRFEHRGVLLAGPPFTVTFVERPDTTTSLAVRFPVVLWTEEDAIILPPDDAYGAPFYVDPPGQPGMHRDLFKTWARRVAGELATRGYPMSAAVRSHLPTEYLSDSEYIASPSERSVSE